jgi:long-chain fatty acid transport protein
VVPPFHAYVSGGITDNLSIGIGVFTPFGLRVKWPDGWEGRRVSAESSLQTWYINPTVAYSFGPLRIGAGFQLVRGTVELKRDIAFGQQEGRVDLGAGTWGAGANVGVQIDLLEQFLTLGVHYRSAVKLNFDGDAHFSNVPPSFASTLRDQAVSTSLTQPDSLAFGVASRPIEPLLIDVDVVWLGWSKLRSVDLRFPDDASGTLSNSSAKNWSSGVNFHVGGEARVHDNWRVRAGVLYDPSPSPANTLTPDVPDANRLNLAAGGSYVHPSGFHVDLGYQFLVLFSKTSTAPPLYGEYGGNVNILGITLGYRSPTSAATGTTAPYASAPPPPPPVLPDQWEEPPPPEEPAQPAAPAVPAEPAAPAEPPPPEEPEPSPPAPGTP